MIDGVNLWIQPAAYRVVPDGFSDGLGILGIGHDSNLNILYRPSSNHVDGAYLNGIQ